MHVFSAPRLVHGGALLFLLWAGRYHNGDPLWSGAPTRQARQNPSYPIPRAGRHGKPSALSPPAEACLRADARKSSEHFSCMSPRGGGPGLSWLHWGTHGFLGGLVMAPRAPRDCGTSLSGPCGTSTTICSHPTDIHPQKNSASGMSGPTVTSRWQGGATDSPPVIPFSSPVCVHIHPVNTGSHGLRGWSPFVHKANSLFLPPTTLQ